MARQNKKSRIKGLPPKIFLQENDSYPEQHLENSDGVYQPIQWNDNNTITYTVESSYSYGSSVPGRFYDRPIYQNFGQDFQVFLSSTQGSVPRSGSSTSYATVNGTPFIYFPLNNTLDNSGSNNFNVTAIGSTVYKSGPGNGFSSAYANNNSYLTNTTNTASLITGDLTISFMFKFDEINSGSSPADAAWIPIVYAGDTSFVDTLYGMYFIADRTQNNIYINFGANFDDTIFEPICSVTDISSSGYLDYNHFAITKQTLGGTTYAKVYINGNLFASVDGPVISTSTGSADFFIAGVPISEDVPPFDGIDGRLSGLKIYNTILTEEQIFKEAIFVRNIIRTDKVYSGSVNKSNLENIVSFHQQNNIKPFTEHKHLAISADTTILTGSKLKDFYKNGSSVEEANSEYFNQPLSSKTKFVIDVTPKEECSIAMRNFSSSSRNYPMCYWNKDTKTWEGIGSGKEHSHPDYFYQAGASAPTIESAYTKFLNEQCIGFGNTTYGNNTSYHKYGDPTIQSNILKSFGSPINNFLFPVHSKFNATSSNLIKMSDYIKRPFLLEKIVVEVSATLNSNRMFGQWMSQSATMQGFAGRSPDASVCTFFLLNQINGVNESYTNSTTVRSGSEVIQAKISSSTIATNHTTRELVTWGGIYGYSDYFQEANLNTSFINNLKRLVPSASFFVDDTLYNWDELSNIGTSSYRDNDLVPFLSYSSAIDTQRSLAAKIALAQEKEAFVYTVGINPSTFSSSNPQYNTIVGPNGYTGQIPFRQFIVNNGTHSYSTWTKNITLPLKCKVPLKKDDFYVSSLYDPDASGGESPSGSVSSGISMFIGSSMGGRRFDNKIHGRELKNVLKDPGYPPVDSNSNIGASVVYETSIFERVSASLYGYDEVCIETPYLLMPSDNLIFGFQLPIPAVFVKQYNQPGFINEANHTLGVEMSFAPVPSKITFYGSYISEGKEVHNTLKQPLSSNTVHVVIGDD